LILNNGYAFGMASSTSTNIHATAAERLRRDGQRYTTNRRTLVEVLDDADRPLTIPELLSQRAGIPQSSAYRNLAVLERAGVVERVMATDEFARYELAEDLTDHHHHHLICAGCGAVSDFVVSAALERRLDAAVDAVASDTGYTIEGHRFDLIGRCADCSSAGR
jgi:Fur family transcriptional regulator, ferric uptake regulator